MKVLLALGALLMTVFAGAAVPAERPLAVITVAAVGDIMMGSDHPDVKLPPNDGIGIFDGVQDALRGADIVFGNLEGPLLDGGASTKCETMTYCFAFRTPTRYVRYLQESGFNVLGIANNHANDFGEKGRESTLRTLVAAGIQPAGGTAVALFNIRGRSVVVAGFSYSTSAPYSFNLLDIAGAKRIVRDLKARHDIVIVSFHGGAEGRSAQHVPGKPEVYVGERRGDVMAFAHAVIDAGAAMVIGHGPHVVRALELYKGKLIAYSLGNFLTYERFNLEGASGRSFVLQARLDADTGEFVGGQAVSVRLVNEGIPERDPEQQAAGLVRRLTQQDIPNANITIAEDGTLAPRHFSAVKKDQGSGRDSPIGRPKARPR